MLVSMFEKVKIATYVNEHKAELDQIMKQIFEHWNKIGQLDPDEKKSNHMQEIFLSSMIRIWLTTAGMPKEHQKVILEQLIKTL